MSLFGGGGIENMALGMLKKMMQSKGATSGRFWVTEKGDIDAELVTAEQQAKHDAEQAELRRVYQLYLTTGFTGQTLNDGGK